MSELWYEIRMLLVTWLVSITMWVAPKKGGGLRLLLALKAHYEIEVAAEGGHIDSHVCPPAEGS